MRRLAFPLLALLAASACAHEPYGYGYDGYGHGYGYGADHGGYAYAGDDWQVGGDPYGRLDPWLEETREGREIVARNLGPGGWHPDAVAQLNLRFRLFADTDRNFRVTDEEIRLALVRCATYGWTW